jgi:16S rRNA C967 or C1407 C5-methylase (RsmB/RsmF family)/NOL1/NOP2/fmu family ribosome biogenesis protein
MQRLLGDEFPAFLAACAGPPVAGLRANTLKLDVHLLNIVYPLIRYADGLSQPSAFPWCPSGFPLLPGAQSGKHPFHAAGLYYLQDPSAMAVAELLAPQPGERVLDLAAAPGGKTTHIAALMRSQGLLVANEIHPRRVWELAENLERCGVTHAAVLNETPERLADHFGAFFDRVLLDAPCSGEGMFRKSESARQAWTPELVRSCALRQAAILEAAARLARPGGILAYSTCTFAPEENEAVIAGFLHGHPEFELLESARFPGFTPGRGDWLEDGAGEALPLQRTVRLWPHQGGPEGHFIAVLQRQGGGREAAPPQARKPRGGRLSAEVKTAFGKFWQDTLLLPAPQDRLALHGAYLYRVPEGLRDLAGLKVIHPGWWLGEMKKARFEPSHGLALGIKAENARRTVDLSVQDAPAYLRGETLSAEGEPGRVLVTVRVAGNSFPLGWGKRVGSSIKNAYPKGLRWPGQ